MENEVKEKETTGTEGKETEGKEHETKVNYEEEYIRLMAENKKLKATVDKSSSEAADYKKKWKATLDENQQKELAKEESDKALREELELLRRERDFGNAEKAFLKLGYAEELASKAAEAQLNGDFDSLMEIQKTHIEKISKDAIAKATKSMAIPPTDNDGKTISKEQFDKMSLEERSNLYQKDKDLYLSLVGRK